jgi:CheY-like chemotaxis protein/two-component sensor histidine kinase
MKYSPRRGAGNLFGLDAEGEERARLVAALGHDIKGPLQVLGLSLQNLLVRVPDQDARQILFAAESAFDEIASLNEDLLDALRFGIGATAPREEGITLANMLRELERRFKRRAAHERVELRMVPSRIHCVADRHYVQRILGNLVENAFKHAQASRIVVGARMRGYEKVLLEVIDDGRGIPREELPYIFEEWFRGRQAVRENARGQGLGLWAVQRCAEAMGGRVHVNSELGRGTRFTVEIPTYAQRRMQVAEVPVRGVDGLEQRLVAVLDDEEDVVTAMRMSLEALGARVFAASDDLYFLSRLTGMSQPPDLVLLDFNLGGRTAERTLAILRTKFGDALRAVVITGQGVDSRLQALPLDVPVIAKPLSAQHLQRIAAVLCGTEPFGSNTFK